MQINLKQAEIERAIKNYIAQQGIDMYGKEVTLAFTAGRKESGISVEISIEEDVAITSSMLGNMMSMPVNTTVSEGNSAEVQETPEAAVVVVTEGNEAQAKVSTSLFG